MAFEYTAGWRAVLPLAATLCGALGTVALTQWSERRRDKARQGHELALRELEARDARQARFHEQRLVAYREVGRHILARRRLGRVVWLAGVGWASAKQRGVADEPEGQEAKATSDAVSAAYQHAGEALEDALISLHSVATPPVRTEALKVQEAITRQVQASLQLLELTGDAERYRTTHAAAMEAQSDGEARRDTPVGSNQQGDGTRRAIAS